MRRVLCALAIVAGAVDLSSGQAVPSNPPADFSGRWTLVSTPPGGSTDPLGREGVIKQDASAVTFTAGNRSVTYPLDGSESTSTTVVGLKLRSSARWATFALLISTKTESATSGWEDLLICSLAGKDTLNIVKVSAVASPNAMSTTLMTYRRN